MMNDIGTVMGESIVNLFAQGEEGMKGFMKNILNLMIDSLHKIVLLKQAEVTITSIPLGPFGWIKAAAQAALIEAAFAAAKAVVNSFDRGGYTPSGAWDKPQGVVHSGEFVSNRFAVANPSLRPLFDLIDYAQRNNTVANLTGEDIAAVAGRNPGNPTRGNVPANNPDKAGNELMLVSVIAECTNTLKKVKERFDEPIVAQTYATGKGGTIQAEELVRKMQANVSRKS
ncbi:hypothetical protein EZS27_030735, partial [termite gut metagenome]